MRLFWAIFFVLGDEGRGGGHDFTLFLLCIFFGVAGILERGYMLWPQAAEWNMITTINAWITIGPREACYELRV
jgi:hypothetical protein